MYQTIRQSFIDNGNRHARKAAYWRGEGKPDYAEGSMRKARKNWAKAEAWAVTLPPNIEMAYAVTLAAIEQNLFTQGTGVGGLGDLF